MAYSINDILTGACVPFGFSLGGRAAGIEKLRHRRTHTAGRDEIVLVYDVANQPLQVWLQLEHRPEHGTATGRLTLRAEREIRDLIEDFALFDLDIADDPDDPHRLRTINGGGIFGFPEAESGHLKNNPKPTTFDSPHGTYPPREFAMEDHDLDAPVTLEERIEGRGSYKWLPLWFLHQRDGGLWFGPEWSGSWALDARRENGRTRCRLTLPRLRFRLAEGEEVPLPAVTFGIYEGDIWEGCLHLRETIAREISPRFGQQTLRPQTVYQLLGGNQPHFDGAEKSKDVAIAAELGLENLVFASSWYRNVRSGTHFPEHPEWSCRNLEDPTPNWTNWWETCGAFEPGHERFPEGWKNFVENLRDNGLRLGLWCDPRISRLIQEYNEAEDVLAPYREINPRDRAWNLGLIDLGRSEGRRYMLELLEHFVALGAGWFWHDLNVELCERYWDYTESPDRRGLMEVRYILGMQEVYHEFRRRHPDVVIEWCASGGTMIDLGTLRFSDVLWISDYGDPGARDNFAADIGIAYRSRLNWILPATLIMNSVHNRAPADENGRQVSDVHLISQCGGTLAFGQALCQWSQADRDAARQAVAVHKNIRHLLTKNYRSLFPPTPPRPQDSWDGWEFWDPETGEGVLMLFRLSHCQETRQDIQPTAWKPGAKTEVLFGKATLNPNQTTGFTVEMPDNSRAALIHYHNNNSDS